MLQLADSRSSANIMEKAKNVGFFGIQIAMGCNDLSACRNIPAVSDP